MAEVTDLMRVAQYVKSDKTAPSDVYNAACRLLDQQDAHTAFDAAMTKWLRAEDAIQRVRVLSEQAKGGGFGKLCCCFDCEEAQENGWDAPHEPTWTAWTLDPAAVLAVIKATESDGDGRTPQTQGAVEGQEATEAQGAAQ